MIGQEFDDAVQIIVLVERRDGSQHAFQVEMGTVTWEATGFAFGKRLGDGSAGRVTVEGRFHRKNRAGIEQQQGEITS
jgi:hypothetical protein